MTQLEITHNRLLKELEYHIDNSGIPFAYLDTLYDEFKLAVKEANRQVLRELDGD